MKADIFATSSKYKFSLHNFNTFLDTYIEIHLNSRVEVIKRCFSDTRSEKKMFFQIFTCYLTTALYPNNQLILIFYFLA